MTTSSQCQFWDCNETIRRNYFLCSTHYAGYEAGTINQCPACGKYKDAEYDVCLACYRQTAGTWAASRPRSGTAQRDNREFPADKDADRFFVYILLMNNGEYYVGQTREIHERLHEHRNNMTLSTKGREPKLQWFTTVRTRREAADLEAELQKLNSNATSRREINRLIVDFKQLSEQLDHAPHRSQAQSTVQERRLPYGGVAPPSRRQRS